MRGVGVLRTGRAKLSTIFKCCCVQSFTARERISPPRQNEALIPLNRAADDKERSCETYAAYPVWSPDAPGLALLNNRCDTLQKK